MPASTPSDPANRHGSENPMPDRQPGLTGLARGGACGGKVSPAVLRDILGGMPAGIVPPQLLVGSETSDDAAVYQVNAQQAVVATADFFTPIVDDPHDFGRIAATNALSAIYAMGATPLLALAIVGMPVKVLPVASIARILEGGAAVCREAGIPIAGGHTIDSVEPIYGLVAIGQVNPAHLKRNSAARAGDVLLLGKALGVGIYGAAQGKDLLHASDYQALLDTTTQLNTPGPLLSCLDGVHAVTDVGGSGLLGNLLEICQGSALRATLRAAALPVLPRVREFTAAGCITGASDRNWASYGGRVRLGEGVGETERAVLTDPQASGGLLVSCRPDTVTEILSLFLQQGFGHVSIIGELGVGTPGIDVV